jgi:hypothetical protein
MPIIRINTPPMLTSDIYDAVNAKAGVDEKPPEGLLMHCAGEVDGTFQIVDVWESEEHAQRFDSERLGPAIEEVVFAANPEQAPPPGAMPSTIRYELHNLILP